MAYQYKRSTSRKSLAMLLIIGILVGSLGTYYYTQAYQAPTYKTPENFYTPEQASYFRIQINLVAVDQNGKGLSTPLVVELKPGTGEALTNIDKLLFWTDTQQSIQTAKAVAENVTGINASGYDIIYSIESNASVVGGPSAGAALAVATMAALRHDSVRSDVVITGTVNDDGTIGQIGGVLEKAQAAKDIGAKVFLVPIGQGEQTSLKPFESCVNRGRMQVCETTYQQQTVNIGKDVGISVIEVANVTEAYKYFKL
jgi:uncharacterized protein